MCDQLKGEQNMVEKINATSERKWDFTKTQAIIVMLIGSLLLVASMIVPTETGTPAHTVKVIAGLIGACVLFVGIWRRPMKAQPQK